MANNPPPLDARPKKGILKLKSFSGGSMDPEDATEDPEGRKEFQWDEMNILETYHPADKDYGHMKVDEAPTPYEASIASDDDTAEGASCGGPSEDADAVSDQPPQPQKRRTSFSDAVSPDALIERLEEAAATGQDDAAAAAARPRRGSCEFHDLDAEDELDEAERERRRQFRLKRKMHYNEFQAVLRARSEADDDEEEAGANV